MEEKPEIMMFYQVLDIKLASVAWRWEPSLPNLGSRLEQKDNFSLCGALRGRKI
jgi:hypothetical protein